MALLAPAAEVAAPLFVSAAELLLWVVLIVVEIILGLFSRRKVVFPAKPQFTEARNGLRSFAKKAKEKRAAKKINS
jgi:hypothetical protein